MALLQVARCMCGHTMIEHCEEDEVGLYFGNGCSSTDCGCEEYSPDIQNMEVVEMFFTENVEVVEAESLHPIGETILD